LGKRRKEVNYTNARLDDERKEHPKGEIRLPQAGSVRHSPGMRVTKKKPLKRRSTALRGI